MNERQLLSTQAHAASKPPPPAPFSRYAGWLSLTAGALFIVAQVVMWSFDQRLNVATAQDVVFQTAKIGYLAGFIVLMFALIAAHGRQAPRAGRLGAVAAGTAVVGTMLLAGDLWFESFVVPWLAAAAPQVLTSEPSVLLALVPSPATCCSPPDGHCSASRACVPGCSRSPSPASSRSAVSPGSTPCSHPVGSRSGWPSPRWADGCWRRDGPRKQIPAGASRDRDHRLLCLNWSRSQTV
jgi:hypothetical protein